MGNMLGKALLFLVMATSFCASASAGEAVTYRGTGSYFVTRMVLPMASGGAAVHLINDTIATIAPSESGFIFGDCSGLVFLSPTGEASSSVYCTFNETGDDSFDLHARGDGTGGSVEISAAAVNGPAPRVAARSRKNGPRTYAAPTSTSSRFRLREEPARYV